MSKAQQKYALSLACSHQDEIKDITETIQGLVSGGANLAGANEMAATWNNSSESDKKDGIDAMKAATSQRDPQQHGLGKVEQLAGKAVGCEGMEQEGSATTNNKQPPKTT